jgi:hypothetical protein
VPPRPLSFPPPPPAFTPPPPQASFAPAKPPTTQPVPSQQFAPPASLYPNAIPQHRAPQGFAPNPAMSPTPPPATTAPQLHEAFGYPEPTPPPPSAAPYERPYASFAPPHFEAQTRGAPAAAARSSVAPPRNRRMGVLTPGEELALEDAPPVNVLAASVFLGVPLALATMVVAVLALR